MNFLFVRMEGGNNSAIGDFAAACNCRRSYKLNGVGAGGHAGVDTLGKPAKVVGVGVNPCGLVWTTAEVVVLESLPGLGVNDGVGFDGVDVGAERIMRGSWVVGVGRNDVCVVLERIPSVQCGFSRGRSEMWRSHPRSLCGV